MACSCSLSGPCPCLTTAGASSVNIFSGLTRSVYPERATYASMKEAVEVLTLHQAQELGPRHITVNIGAVICSAAAGWITARRIEVAGGMHL